MIIRIMENGVEWVKMRKDVYFIFFVGGKGRRSERRYGSIFFVR